MKTKPIIIFLLLSLTQCTDKSPAKSNHPAEGSSVPRQKTSSANKNILNNIVAEEKGGLKIAAAYLADAGGKIINPQNTVAPGSPVFLIIQIQDGWRVNKGYVSPGALQTITTQNGEPVLQSPDLFAGAKSIRAADAANLQLKTVIINTRPDIAYYIVRFRIWDKGGTGAINGYYHLWVEN
ncbi:MAG: hypothetical protein M3Q06_02855 [Bacteroidota bacterium]|nr:hypothetical protein [Bacteroidota bacterium]